MIIHYKHFENQQKIYTLFKEPSAQFFLNFKKRKSWALQKIWDRCITTYFKNTLQNNAYSTVPASLAT